MDSDNLPDRLGLRIHTNSSMLRRDFGHVKGKRSAGDRNDNLVDLPICARRVLAPVPNRIPEV